MNSTGAFIEIWRSFSPSPVHLAQLPLLPPCLLPSLSVPHLQHLQTRPGRSGPWCGNRSLPHLNYSPENSLHFPDSEGRKYFSYIWKEKKYPNGWPKKKKKKIPFFYFMLGNLKRKTFLCFPAMVVAEKGQVGPYSRAGTKVLLRRGWATSPDDERNWASFVHMLVSGPSLPVN